MVRGIADFPFTRQYRGTTPYLYFIEQQVRWGMGWFLGLVGWTAFGWAIVKTLLGRAKVGEWPILSWLVPYFLITGSFLAKFSRYMVPVVPFLTVLGAGMLWALALWLARRRLGRGVAVIATAETTMAATLTAEGLTVARHEAAVTGQIEPAAGLARRLFWIGG